MEGYGLSVQVAVSNAITRGIDHGHVALLVNGKAYSYGRYGEERTSISGDGVLRIYYNANEYLDLTREDGEDISVYTLNLTDSEAEKIIEYYESNRIPYNHDSNKRPNHQSFTYSDPKGSYELLLGDNCATIVIEAIHAGRPGSMNLLTGDPNIPVSPWGLNHALMYDLHTNHTLVTDYYYMGRLPDESRVSNPFSSSNDGSDGAEQGNWDPMNRVAFSDTRNGW
jgi:hypothetical protein